MRVEERGRVELHEFHVGDRGAGAVGHGDAVAGGDVRIAGIQIDFPGASRGQNGKAGAESDDLLGAGNEDVGAQADIGRHPPVADLRLGDEIDGAVVFVDTDIRVALDRFDQRPFDLLAGDVLGVEDAPGAVSPFAGQVVIAGFVPGKIDAPVDQVLDRFGAGFDDPANDVFPCQMSAGDDGVLHVGIEAVFGGENRGDPSLGQVGGGLGQFLLGDDGNGSPVGDLEGIGESGDAGADDEKVGGYFHGRVQYIKKERVAQEIHLGWSLSGRPDAMSRLLPGV